MKESYCFSRELDLTILSSSHWRLMIALKLWHCHCVSSASIALKCSWPKPCFAGYMWFHDSVYILYIWNSTVTFCKEITTVRDQHQCKQKANTHRLQSWNHIPKCEHFLWCFFLLDFGFFMQLAEDMILKGRVVNDHFGLADGFRWCWMLVVMQQGWIS